MTDVKCFDALENQFVSFNLKKEQNVFAASVHFYIADNYLPAESEIQMYLWVRNILYRYTFKSTAT